MMLLERAFNGTEKVVRGNDGSEEKMRGYSNQLGLAYLKMRRDTVIESDDQFPPDDIAEIRARIVRKLHRLKKRDEEQEAGRAERPGAAPRAGDPEHGERGAATPGH